MDYFKEAEELLYSVPRKERAIEQMQARKARLMRKGAPTAPKGIDPSKPYTRASFESDTMNDLCELSDVCRKIAETQAALDEIKDAVAAIGSEELQLCLRLWYFERLPKEKIAERIDRWSKTTVYNKRNEGVYEFARIYWGVSAEKPHRKN